MAFIDTEAVTSNMLANSYYETLATTELPKNELDGKPVVTDPEDTFIVTVAQITVKDLMALVDAKLMNKRDVAARFYALSLSLNHANVTDRQIYDALKEYDCHPGLVAIVREIGRGVVLDAMELLDASEVSDVDVVFCVAAEKGLVPVMELLELWGARDYDAALESAAAAGQVEAMRRVRQWGDVDYQRALTAAVVTGQTEAMKLAHEWINEEWSSSDYEDVLDDILKVAEENSQAGAIALIEKWLSNSYRETLNR